MKLYCFEHSPFAARVLLGLPLIGQLDPRARDAAVVETAFVRMDEGFAQLNAFMTGAATPWAMR